MTAQWQAMQQSLQQALGMQAKLSRSGDMLELDVAPDQLLATAITLRDDPSLAFAQLSDLCGVDFATYGRAEWSTNTESMASFSRAVNASSTGSLTFDSGMDLPASDKPRFAAVYHLLSIEHNIRMRVRCSAVDDDLPVIPSVITAWNNADWYEREAFDLFGILFDGHPDLRRLLTDYGFTGHPFRKDFPLIGNVEMRYDPVKERVVYEPVSIKPRVLVPRVIRDDSRYIAGDTPAEPSDN